MHRHVFWRQLGGLLLVLASLAACGSQGATPRPLLCNTAYRSAVTGPIEHEDQLRLTQIASTPATITYADLAFHAQYMSEPGSGPSLNLFVTPPDRTDRLMSVLYQLPPATTPANQFVGGHGFTGLHYVYHPTSGAELQFWCVAE